MFFARKHASKKHERDNEYFRYRDSLTGVMNRDFCFKEYERLKRLDEYSAVTVRLSGCGEMLYCDAEEKIKGTGELIARICDGNFSRVENGDFVLFSKDAEAIEEKLIFFLKEISEDKERYAICYDKLDENESFDIFLRRIQRHVGVMEYSIR